MKIKYFLSFIIISAITLTACSDEEAEQGISVTPGNRYELTVNISSQKGGDPNAYTKAFDQFGGFTDEYDAEYVYIHSTTDAAKVVKLPILTQQSGCEDCDGKGFEYNVEVSEDGSSYTISSADGSSSAMFSASEEVYFSSEEYEVWEGESVDASPVSSQSVLVRNEEKNKEIYRSAEDYSVEGLINLGTSSTLTMQRKCSAFRVYFMFTDLDNPQTVTDEFGNTETVYSCNAESFEEFTTQVPSTWSGKLYIGPYFSDKYNINTGEATYADDHQYGYYATNEQKYTSFRGVSYTRTEDLEEQKFEGYGITTAGSDYLITPYDINSNAQFTFYAFIKDNTDDPDSDTGSKYVSYSWADVPEFNTTQVIVIIYNVKELAKGFDKTTPSAATKGLQTEPQRLDVQPAKVIFLQN